MGCLRSLLAFSIPPSFYNFHEKAFRPLKISGKKFVNAMTKHPVLPRPFGGGPSLLMVLIQAICTNSVKLLTSTSICFPIYSPCLANVSRISRSTATKRNSA